MEQALREMMRMARATEEWAVGAAAEATRIHDDEAYDAAVAVIDAARECYQKAEEALEALEKVLSVLWPETPFGASPGVCRA